MNILIITINYFNIECFKINFPRVVFFHIALIIALRVL